MHPLGQAKSARYALADSDSATATRRMARKPRPNRESPFKIRAWRKHTGLTLEAVAGELGMSPQNLGKIERGLVDLLPEHIEPLAEIFGTAPPSLMMDPDEAPANDATDLVAVVGFVGAGAVAVLHPEGQGPFDHVEPPADRTASTVALEIQGVSLGPILDRALVFYDDVRSPVTPDLHGRLCVVGLKDGRVLIKMLKPATDGRFHLLSNSADPPMLDEEVEWAARVKDIRPT